MTTIDREYALDVQVSAGGGVVFEYWAGENHLRGEAEILSLGKPAKTDCLPEDSFPAEPAEAEIVSCFVHDDDGNEAALDPSGLWVRPHGSTSLVRLADLIEDAAIEAALDMGDL